MVTEQNEVDDMHIKEEANEDDEAEFDADAEGDDDELNANSEETLASLEDAQFYEDGDLKIKQINEAGVMNRNLKDLFVLMKTPYLDLNPEYQRDVVWDESRSSALIASLFQGYFIPPLIFNCKHRMVNGEMRTFRICVDGKQRLTSIYKFMTGKIGFLDSNIPPKKWFYCNALDAEGKEKKSNHLILSEKSKIFFRHRKLGCYEFKELHPSTEENMFQLVQRGLPLTSAEKLRAMSTNWAKFGKKYETDYPRVINLCFQKRASGFRAIISIFAQLMEVDSATPGNGRSSKNRNNNASINPTLQTGANTLTRLVGRHDCALNETAKLHFKAIFDKFQELIDLDTTELPGKTPGYKIDRNSAFAKEPDFLREPGVSHVKTFSPLELLSTAVLLSVHGKDRTNDMLIGDIKEMRYFLRENHKDLRLNNSCWATAWKFIDVELVLRRGGNGTRPEQRAALVPDGGLPIAFSNGYSAGASASAADGFVVNEAGANAPGPSRRSRAKADANASHGHAARGLPSLESTAQDVEYAGWLTGSRGAFPTRTSARQRSQTARETTSASASATASGTKRYVDLDILDEEANGAATKRSRKG